MSRLLAMVKEMKKTASQPLPSELENMKSMFAAQSAALQSQFEAERKITLDAKAKEAQEAAFEAKLAEKDARIKAITATKAAKHRVVSPISQAGSRVSYVSNVIDNFDTTLPPPPDLGLTPPVSPVSSQPPGAYVRPRRRVRQRRTVPSIADANAASAIPAVSAVLADATIVIVPDHPTGTVTPEPFAPPIPKPIVGYDPPSLVNMPGPREDLGLPPGLPGTPPLVDHEISSSPAFGIVSKPKLVSFAPDTLDVPYDADRYKRFKERQKDTFD